MSTELPITLEGCKDFFIQAGGTDIAYLEHHWQRFFRTYEEVERTRPLQPSDQVLDIGAHWLHQAYIYAARGCSVTALDMPITMEDSNVINAAGQLHISLKSETSLHDPQSLSATPENTFDLVLFTEIVEHITFNPVNMWKEIYRVMKPGGRIVITTPNYYAWRGRLWNFKRFLTRFGGGIEISEILNLRTYAHHWKEYSLRELIYYFCLLSPDFNCIKYEHLRQFSNKYMQKDASRLDLLIEKIVPVLRPNLHLEVEIREKSKGITLNPTW